MLFIVLVESESFTAEKGRLELGEENRKNLMEMEEREKGSVWFLCLGE